jgi:hypothetical protein
MKCNQEKCFLEAEKDGLCEIHYWHSIWLDNSNIDDLGIVRFAKMILPEWLRNNVPEFHKEVYHEFILLYSPDRDNKYKRLFAEIGFRGAAKTTISKVILLYCCCFSLEKFIIYCSATNSFAVQDVFEVRRELSSNPGIRHYFGAISSKAVKGQDGQWSRDAFLTVPSSYTSAKSGVFVLARGVGQQVRSALRNSYRPTLALVNDMYGKDDVKTEYTRAEFSKWFFQDMFNAVDDIEGKVFFNGTILHQDTVPVVLEKNESWKVLKYPVMEIGDFHKALKYCEVTEDKINLPSQEIIDELQKECKLYWPERLGLYYILTKYKESYESGQAAGFFQEYFHIVVPPDEKAFKYIQRVKMTFIRADQRTWLKVKFSTDIEVTYEVNMFAGLDPASAVTQNSKYSAIVIIGMNKERQVFVYSYARGKYAARDELNAGYRKAGDSDIVEPVRSNIKRIGMVDEEIRLVKQFRVVATAVETVQQQQSIFDEINRIMRVNNAFHRLHSIKPTQNKIDRDADTLGPYFQTGSIFINYGLSELEGELEQFPRGTTVDLIDALQMAVSIARPADGADFASAYKEKNEDDEYIREFMAL